MFDASYFFFALCSCHPNIVQTYETRCAQINDEFVRHVMEQMEAQVRKDVQPPPLFIFVPLLTSCLPLNMHLQMLDYDVCAVHAFLQNGESSHMQPVQSRVSGGLSGQPLQIDQYSWWPMVMCWYRAPSVLILVEAKK
jgi:hypothetical protein